MTSDEINCGYYWYEDDMFLQPVQIVNSPKGLVALVFGCESQKPLSEMPGTFTSIPDPK